MLIYVRNTGAVDNDACRELTGLDTLKASRFAPPAPRPRPAGQGRPGQPVPLPRPGASGGIPGRTPGGVRPKRWDARRRRREPGRSSGRRGDHQGLKAPRHTRIRDARRQAALLLQGGAASADLEGLRARPPAMPTSSPGCSIAGRATSRESTWPRWWPRGVGLALPRVAQASRAEVHDSVRRADSASDG